MLVIDGGQAGPHEVHTGVPFTIALDETPTSGYRWDFEVLPDSVQLLRHSLQLHTGSAIGGGGQRRFVMQSNRPGTHTLVLSLFQPWTSPASAVQRHTFVINSQP